MVIPANDFRLEMSSLWTREDELKTKQAALKEELEALQAMVTDRETQAKNRENDLQAVQKDIELLLQAQSSALPPVQALTPQVSRPKTADKVKPPRNSMLPPSVSSKLSDQRHITQSAKQAPARQTAKANLDVLYPALHWRYPNVIMLDGKPTAIACHICGANSNHTSLTYKNEFIKGPIGFQLHVTRCHPEAVGLSVDQILDRCTRTILSPHDGDLVRQGLPPSKPIPTIMGYADGTNRVLENGVFASKNGEITILGPRQKQVSPLPAEPDQNDVLCFTNHRNALFIDGQWYNISCHICGVNARLHRGYKDFLVGWIGLLNHMSSAHPPKNGKRYRKASCIALCSKSIIDSKTVARIRRGEIVLPLVAMCFGNDAATIVHVAKHDSPAEDRTLALPKPAARPQFRIIGSSKPTARPEGTVTGSVTMFRGQTPPPAPMISSSAADELQRSKAKTSIMTQSLALTQQGEKRDPNDLAKIGPFKKRDAEALAKMGPFKKREPDALASVGPGKKKPRRVFEDDEDED